MTALITFLVFMLSSAVSEVLDFSSNAFTGTIPEEFIHFSGLVLFDNNEL